MRPIKAPGANVALTIAGAPPMPAERCRFANPNPPFESHDGFETTWELDEGEQRAAANGAPVVLRLWGQLHPPVSLHVGEPPADADLDPLVNLGHVFRAVGRLYQLLVAHSGGDPEQAATLVLGNLPDIAALEEQANRDEEPVEVTGPGEPCNAEQFLQLWERALQETKTT